MQNNIAKDLGIYKNKPSNNTKPTVSETKSIAAPLSTIWIAGMIPGAFVDTGAETGGVTTTGAATGAAGAEVH